MSDQALDPTAKVDLTNCEREQIQFLGRVQSFGCLVAVSPDWMISHASENCVDILGVAADAMIGDAFAAHFPDNTVHTLRSRLQMLVQEETTARVFAIDLLGDGRFFDVSIHQSGRSLVFEFEAAPDARTRRDEASMVKALMTRVRRQDTKDAFLQEAAICLQALLGVDRVMVYRFEEDGCGTVAAEALGAKLEPFLGLRYPASDIPRQARALYVRNPIRIIADVHDETHPISPQVDASGQMFDLSLAVTRAVSPIHIEYLKNMGVRASVSVSILRKDQLWGLFACHHGSPLSISFEKRTAVELFVQLFNYELAQFENERELEDLAAAQALHDQLMSRMSSGGTVIENFERFADDIKTVIPYDGLAIYSEGVYKAFGLAPTAEEFLGLARFLNTSPGGEIIAFDNISTSYDRAENFAERAAGLLAIPISRSPRDYLVLFRQELARTVTWAGSPEKPVEVGENGVRLTPRKSFEAWQEVVRDHSAPWKNSEKRAANALRVTLLEVVLKLTDQASGTEKRAREQQALLIGELNHRVRNILNLIRGLVSQGRGGAETVEDYCDVLDHRIHSLARAHDQLTAKNWSWASLRNLIQTEVDAFLNAKSARVLLKGDDIDLSPAAFTTFALVMHELVTNSAKYGALSDSRGEVEVHVSTDADGMAVISWAERQGPPVKAPTRRGFGTTIIHESVPFELKGQAKVDYKVTGLEAVFTIPSSHFTEGSAESGETPKRSAPAKDDAAVLSGDVLIVEDNVIIAMDAAEILGDLGADHIHKTATVEDALRMLGENEISFALLDVNLGDESSLAVAEACAESGVPFVLATGYGANDDITRSFPSSPILKKPYSTRQMRAAVADATNLDA